MRLKTSKATAAKTGHKKELNLINVFETKLIKLISLNLMMFTLALATPPAFAAAKPKTEEINPYNRNSAVAKIIMGKIIIPVSAGLGPALFVAGAFMLPYDTCKNSGRKDCVPVSVLMPVGFAVLAIGLPTGIALRIMGGRELTKWENWETDHGHQITDLVGKGMSAQLTWSIGGN